jgi:hypothetical protein
MVPFIGLAFLGFILTVFSLSVVIPGEDRVADPTLAVPGILLLITGAVGAGLVRLRG